MCFVFNIIHFTQAWRVSDPTRRLIYNLLRSPVGLWDALKICYNESKPQDAGSICLAERLKEMILVWTKWFNHPYHKALTALTMDNLDDDYFVVGNELVESPDLWKEIQAGGKNMQNDQKELACLSCWYFTPTNL